MTGSEHFTPYNMKDPLYFYYNNSGSSVYNLTGSKHFSPYKLKEPIYFGGNSGSYFHLTTGSSYFAQYNMKDPLYFYWEKSGSSDNYLINFSQSAYIPPYEEGTITAPSSSGANGNWSNITLRDVNRQVADSVGLLNFERRFRDGSQFRSGIPGTATATITFLLALSVGNTITIIEEELQD